MELSVHRGWDHVRQGYSGNYPKIRYHDPAPFALDEGQEVTVIDEDSIHVNARGVVTSRTAAQPENRYRVKLGYRAGAIFSFAESQLRGILTASAPQAKPAVLHLLPEYSRAPMWTSRDIFQCEWGKFRLDLHPDIPRRYIAWKKRRAAQNKCLQPVIELPAHTQSGAHEKFMAFMKRIAYQSLIDALAMPAQDEEIGLLDLIMAQEAAKIPPRQGKMRRKSRKGSVLPFNARKSRKSPKTPKRVQSGGLRIRKVAA